MFNITSPGVSVIMPVYNQSSFIKCAIRSLLAQTHISWEVIIVDDGSSDEPDKVISEYFQDKRIQLLTNDKNYGLGYSLNKGINHSHFPIIAYLPADDIYFHNHLTSLLGTMSVTGADFVYSGVVYNVENNGGEKRSLSAKGKIYDHPLQLVQVMHKKTDARWTERSELVTDDLDRMFWRKYLTNNCKTAGTNLVTCEWVSHLYQRHNIMTDRNGGIYMYKTFYGVKEPIRYQSSTGNYIDEIEQFSNFQKPLSANKNGLKILLVGELSYNPERILAFESRGHKLFGLWINNPSNFNSVGPLPFGNVEDIPFDSWEEKVKEIQPDIIYALLNFKAIPLAHIILKRNLGIPFVWHFKEGPFYCRTTGLWNKLIDLQTKTDGVIYTNTMMREWFDMFISVDNKRNMVIDGDLPNEYWFTDNREPLLSKKDGEIHTVVAGRLLGISAEDIEVMAHQDIHTHVYGDVFHNQSRNMLDEAMALAPDHLHLHPNCPQERWVSEFSRYDAGWLHYYKSINNGDLARANWIDINSPARLATYAMAGLPMLMHNNEGHHVHHQKYLESLNMAIPINAFSELVDTFSDKERIAGIRQSVWKNRDLFCFDHYVDELIAFFRSVIKDKT